MKITRIVLILTLFFQSSSMFGQTKKSFSNDAATFENEIKEFFAQDKRAESKESIDQFMELWDKENAFDPNEQAKIIETCNLLLKNRMRVYPDFVQYFNTMSAYKAGKVAKGKFDKYHEVLQQILTKNKKDFADFSETARLLFSELAIYKNEAKVWRVSNDVYEFEYKGEPSILFPAVELQLYTKEDTLGIYQTTGRYFTNSNKWFGTGGNVYWTRVGFSKDRASAKLKKYNLDVRNSEYSADSAEFSFPKVFGKAILGRLQDKATTNYEGAKSSYPRFQSYQNVFEIKNVFKNVDYKGGFTLEGAQILGTGTDSGRAVVTIKYNGKIAARVWSKAFVIDPEKIAALRAAISIYLDKDSIYHSQLVFNYLEKNRRMTVSRSPEGLYAAPFLDSYHQLEFETGNMIWMIDSSLVYLKTISNPSQATNFSSAFRYEPGGYMRVQSILDYNPIQRIEKYVETYKTRIIDVKDLAAYMNNKVEYINNLLFQLNNEGYIFYDIEGGKVVVTDKLIHYFQAAERNADYDIIKFESIISGKPNAVINLADYKLEVQGVPTIDISDSQSTSIVPTDQTLVIKKNRDMEFKGIIHSGRFDFFGRDLYFNYKAFSFTLTDIDSVKFKYPEFDKEGRVTGMRTIQNTIEHVNGYLYIDKPENKSSKKQYDDYPIFECNKESYVYYDKPSTYKGVYKRDKFYYKINPFVIKNLDHFTAEGLQFPGSFTSADILPVITNALTIQDDYSLGFIQPSPPGGYSLYKTKGIGKGTFYLSNKGLRENGEVEYSNSTTRSDNFIFFPDSMNSRSQSFEIPLANSGKYPPVTGKDVYTHWMPYKDSMYVFKGKEPLSVYGGKIDFSGNLVLTPAELVGTGAMAYQNLNLTSKSFAFLPKNIKTTSGQLKIGSVTGNSKSAIEADDVTANIDLSKDFGKFSTNKDTSKVSLPSNRFSTTLNTFTYDIAKKEAEFTKNDKQSDEDAYFVSTNPEQQGLKFKSKAATFTLSKDDIKAKEVPYVTISDSRIYTPNRELHIEKEGNIGAIKGAEIITSEETQNHRIYNAYINIFSKNKFTGYGNYDYIDKDGKKFVVLMNDIRTDETNHTTIAKGNIADTAKFYLAPGIRYSGGISLVSTKKVLSFEGFVRPDITNKQLRTEWVKVADTINPKTVVLTINDQKAKDGKDLFTGTFLSADTPAVYNLFFGRKKNQADLQIFGTSGIFVYDDSKGEYRYGPTIKVLPDETTEEPSTEGGNLFVYKPNTNQVYSEGLYNFGQVYKHISIATAGTYTYKYSDTSNLFNLVMLVDFPTDDESFKMMTDTLSETTSDEPDLDNSKPDIYNAFALLIPNKKEREKVIADLSTNGFVPSSESLNKTFIFTNLKMSFNDTSKSFYSVGPLGLANAKKINFNKQVKGIIELKHQRAGDRFGMLISPNSGSYHYFGYQGNSMTYLSSDVLYVDKLNVNAAKVEKVVKNNFTLRPATQREVNTLKRKNKKK